MGQDQRGPSDEEDASYSQNLWAILRNSDPPVHVTTLAERLVKEDQPILSADEFTDAVERKLISLHHNVLPRLAASGAIDYDRSANTVTSWEDEGFDTDWLDNDSLAEVLSNLGPDTAPEGDAIGVIDGREAAIEYGRTLADEAEDELFCMYVSTDLLEDECLRHAEDAIDRGVEVYMGSRNMDVRDLTRRELPNATIWEPRRGWLNAPSNYPKVGRLILADRRHVMLAMLDEPGPDGEFPDETTMVGAGENNPLVVLVRELLGPRLDHLDFQSTDFQSQLHS